MTEPIKIPFLDAEFQYELNGSVIKRTLLPNGLRILTEQLPGARSVTIGFWVGVGSRDEQAVSAAAPASLGSTHFLEHLLFKGTATRSAYEIAEGFDRIGADNNALTAKEYTCYHAKVRDSDLPQAVKLLSDMVYSSVIDAGEFETERGVILEELAMAADDLADVAHEQLFSAVLGDHPLGRPIGGTPEMIRGARRDDVWQHYQNHYGANSIVITAAGGVVHEELVELVTEALKTTSDRWGLDSSADPVPRRTIGTVAEVTTAERAVVQRESEQVHVLLGSPGLIIGDENRFSFALMNSILGGGMSSRLFQEIREKRGLAYSTYAFGTSYSDSGVFGMYAGCAPEKAEQVVGLMRDELAKLATTEISDEELSRALGQLAGSSALALEDSETRMARLARAELTQGELWDIDASLERLEKVTKADIVALASDLVSRPQSLVVVGAAAKTGL